MTLLENISEELESISEGLEERCRPVTKPELTMLLLRLSSHWKTDRTAQEWQWVFDDYFEDLQEFSQAHISDAIREHRRSKHWWPKVAELKELAQSYAYKERELARRARVLLGTEEPKYWECT